MNICKRLKSKSKECPSGAKSISTNVMPKKVEKAQMDEIIYPMQGEQCPECDEVFNGHENNFKADTFKRSDSIETFGHNKIEFEYCGGCGFILKQGRLRVTIDDGTGY